FVLLFFFFFSFFSFFSFCSSFSRLDLFFFFSPHHGADIFSFFCFHTLPLCLTSACCKFCQAPLYAAGGAFSMGGGAVISFGAWSGNIGGLDICLLLILLFFPHLQILITKQHLVAGK
ncbi:hypothetical protein IWX49DRAFT_575316, partial [Phyllosticta citricarpa]